MDSSRILFSPIDERKKDEALSKVDLKSESVLSQHSDQSSHGSAMKTESRMPGAMESTIPAEHEPGNVGDSW